VPLELLEGCSAIAAGAGFPPSGAFRERTRATLSSPGAPLTASMMRDLERGARTEADHVLADLASRSQNGAPPLLQLAYLHLKTHEARRAREGKAS
jgi:2-dehydropantoate 2-reductase